MSRILAVSFMLLILIAWSENTVEAGNPFESLLMPGDVVQSHASIEKRCEACHASFDKSAQDSLCLDCHKPIAKDIRNREGFHGRSSLMKNAQCNLCHDDHKGRTVDIVELDKALFDHRSTDFDLSGSHKFLSCDACHAPGRRWAEAPKECVACHDKDQPHRGNLGRACETCHTADNWFTTKTFDHGKTRFVLKGKHTSVACLSCHLGEVYRPLRASCNDCHAVQDPHAQRFGIDCASCHSETGWKPAKFDHAAITRFPLEGAHGKAACASCHGSDTLRPVSSACSDCHAAQDIHKGALGKDCASCHGTALWGKDIRFDHGLTQFPLTGLHAAVVCEACHASPSFKGAAKDCFACHANADVHKGRFATACADCHGTSGWQRVAFDHGRDTRFPLTGQHATTACYGCHSRPNVKSAKLPADCYSCHARQDVHRGKFGQNCAKCHDTRTFSTAIIRN